MGDIFLQALFDFQNGFSWEKNTCALFSRVSEVMPLNTENCKIVNIEGTTSKFKARFKLVSKAKKILLPSLKITL